MNPDFTSYFWKTVSLVIAFFLAAPAIVIIPVSLTPSNYIEMPGVSDFSLRHYHELLKDNRWTTAAWDSLRIALLSSFLATSLSLVASIGIWRSQSKWSAAIQSALLVPLIIPQIATALALYSIWVQTGLYDTLIGVAIAHAILAVPFCIVTISSSLSNLDPRLDKAALSLGASHFRSMWDVLIPSLKPGIAAAALFSFVLSWDEVVVTLFVASRSVSTLPREIWNGVRENLDPSVAAVSTLLILISICIALVAWAKDLSVRAKSGERQ
ncbi:ABC transporter permease [Epibacterium sp. Ofav1-8]|uniref:ABC transporter permease n=1 Tax=Epibacterium sp. Ofav1-8 TaxID=2917735 RepID=UPI001EF3E2A9|nr:ABC transporter permease [Epibacterium sp. Ofav1-8]MCG7625156.1 ABC transporter permease [Epibacterium sp. Ofav1-8]